MNLPDYQVTNDNGRVTVYLLHGIYGAKDYWRYQTQRLVERGYRVIAWEAPGYGISVAGVYHPANGVLADVEGAGGTSPVDAPDAVREKEAVYAEEWYRTITAAVFG